MSWTARRHFARVGTSEPQKVPTTFGKGPQPAFLLSSLSRASGVSIILQSICVDRVDTTEKWTADRPNHTEHENSWVKNMEDQVQGGTSGKSGAAGCAALGNDCNPMNGMSCEDQFDKFGTYPLAKNSYWIFQAVKGLHEKFKELSRQLTQETLINGLRIPQMVTDFDGSEGEPGNVLGWLAAASTIGNAVGGLVPGAVRCPSLSPFHFSLQWRLTRLGSGRRDRWGLRYPRWYLLRSRRPGSG